jgi:hypothetical protein
MAGGDDARWGDYLGARRHFAPIEGEPLILRTVRQLRERDCEVYIIAERPEYRIPGTQLVPPETTQWGQEALNGWNVWDLNGRTLQVYGDVAFTDAALDTICGDAVRRWQLYGRHGRSSVKAYGEIFAIGFWPEHHDAWQAALTEAFRLKEQRVTRRAGSWEGYRILGGAEGAAVDEHRLYPDLMTEIDDRTDDFDTPEEYAALVRLWSESA